MSADYEFQPASTAVGGTGPGSVPPSGFHFYQRPPRPFLGRLKAALTCALLASLTCLVVQATFLVHEATKAVGGLPVAITNELDVARKDVLAQVAATRTELGTQVAQARHDLLTRTEREVAALRTDALGQVAALRTDVMAQADQIRTVADRRLGDTLTRVDTALVKVEELRGDLKPTLDHTASLSKQVDDSAPLFLDCEFNPDCVFNRYVGVSKGIERAAINFSLMSTEVTGAMPTAITTWQGIGTNVAGITANVNQLTKPKWYDRLLGYGLNGIVIYRSLNTATLVAVKAAQILTSRP